MKGYAGTFSPDAALRESLRCVHLPWELRRRPTLLENVTAILDEVIRLRTFTAQHGDLGEIGSRVSAMLMEARIDLSEMAREVERD